MRRMRQNHENEKQGEEWLVMPFIQLQIMTGKKVGRGGI